MVIDCDQIRKVIEADLKKQVKKLKKKLKLVTFYVGKDPNQLHFVEIKKNLAKKLGINFELIHYKTPPNFERFIRKIKEKAIEPETTGVIIQQPLPSQLITNSIYNSIPIEKEIEGHLKKTPYLSPIGMAVLTVLKSIYTKIKKAQSFYIKDEDKNFFKKIFHHKKVVLIGRGITGGQPIGNTLTTFKINYFCLNSKTPSPEYYLKSADLIISAVGKKVITPEIIKPGVVLINIGLRKENNKIKGDYDPEEIKNIASFYTPIINGVGPLDVLYLYKNLIEAAKSHLRGE